MIKPMYDLLVIGGGINGVGIARDAAGRGVKTLLCEKNDLGAHTSSASTKLIHGGLRYLEQYAFRLVRESLMEREVLWRAAPHIVRPLRFVLPYDAGMRPAWLLRLGLFIYDHIGGRKMLPPTARVDLGAPGHRGVLQQRLRFGYEYSDCWVDDARLVALNAVDAVERGATVLTSTTCVGLERCGDGWRARLLGEDGAIQEIEARGVVNAAGPWVDEVNAQANRKNAASGVRLVKGSHIVVKRKYDAEHCYIFQNPDDRIIFAIPYEDDYTLIGTTDVAFDGDRGAVRIAPEEIDYLCAAASEYFTDPVTPDDVVWTYSGVRPLYDDAAASESTVSRDYVFELDCVDGAGPLLSVFGGKITTYRKLAEHAMEKLSGPLGVAAPAWTENAPLPGGEFDQADFQSFLADLHDRYPWLPKDLAHRLAQNYGARIDFVLGSADSLEGLGRHFGAGLYAAEVDYLRRIEFARDADDILWRRTKLGLRLSSTERQALGDWLEDQSNDQFGDQLNGRAEHAGTDNTPIAVASDG